MVSGDTLVVVCHITHCKGDHPTWQSVNDMKYYVSECLHAVMCLWSMYTAMNVKVSVQLCKGKGFVKFSSFIGSQKKSSVISLVFVICSGSNRLAF